MAYSTRSLVTGMALAAAAATLPSLAQAQSQPLNILVNPLALPGAILSAPFALFEPPADPNAYNPEPARAAAVGYTDDLDAIVATPVLRQTGPYYVNPANARRRGAYVLGVGSAVPGFVTTAPLENVSVAGLAPGAEYEFFIAPNGKTVLLDPTSRRVVRILR